MHRVDFFDHTLHGPANDPVPQPAGPKWGPVLFMVIIAGIALFFLMPYLADMVDARTARKQDREDEARRQALTNEIRAKVTLTEGKLDVLIREHRAIKADFLSLCGVPLDQAEKTMTRETARRALKSRAFSKAYTRLVNMRISEDVFTEPRTTIHEVSWNVSVDSAAKSHLAMLDDVLDWIEDTERVLQRQRSMLDQLRQAAL